MISFISIFSLPLNTRNPFSAFGMRIYTLLFLLLFIGSAQSQELAYQQFTTDDGLPSSEVYDMYQDSKGYVWFATDRGLSKFDGETFVNYGLEDGLPSTTVFKFFPQKDGKIWCSTIENKWFWFYPDKGGFNLYKYNDVIISKTKGALYEGFAQIDGVAYFSFEDVYSYLAIDGEGKVLNELSPSRRDIKPSRKANVVFGQFGSFSYWEWVDDHLKSIESTSVLSLDIDSTQSGFRKTSVLSEKAALFSFHSS